MENKREFKLISKKAPRSLLPNALTIFGVCLGLSSIKFALDANYVKMINSNGDELILVQIEGLIARRIVCEIKENNETKQGDKFGIIRFGSRVDLYFENYQLMVNINQQTVAGETIIARKK